MGANCECNPGFSDPSRADADNAGTRCDDVDECAAEFPPCDTLMGHAVCENTHGSFTCTCNPGWTGSGLPSSCQNVHECNTSSDNCHPNATCTDTAGSFSCACSDSGFTGDGVTCCAVPADTSRPLAVSVTFTGDLEALEAASSSSVSDFKAAVVGLLGTASAGCLSASSATVELSAGSIVALVTLDPATVASTTVDTMIAVLRGRIAASDFTATSITDGSTRYIASAISFQPAASAPPSPPRVDDTSFAEVEAEEEDNTGTLIGGIVGGVVVVVIICGLLYYLLPKDEQAAGKDEMEDDDDSYSSEGPELMADQNDGPSQAPYQPDDAIIQQPIGGAATTPDFENFAAPHKQAVVDNPHFQDQMDTQLKVQNAPNAHFENPVTFTPGPGLAGRPTSEYDEPEANLSGVSTVYGTAIQSSNFSSCADQIKTGGLQAIRVLPSGNSPLLPMDEQRLELQMDQLRSAAAIQGSGEGQTLVMPPLSKVSHASVIATPNAHSEESRYNHQVDRQTLLHEFYSSVITGDATKIIQLARYINLDVHLAWDKSGAITKDPNGATALHLAAFHNQPASVEALCSMGASVETSAFKGEYDGNPLHVATRHSHIECLQAMVHYCGNAAFYDVDMDGKTPLDIAHDGHHGAGAQVFNSAEVLAVLDLDELNEFNANATQAAWQQQMGELYSQTRLPEYTGHLDSPPMNELKEEMFRAIQEDDGNKICFLAELEPSLINAEKEKTRETPLEVVAKEPNSMLLAATKALCSRGASIEAVTGEYDRNPLHHAALVRNNKVLEILVHHCGYAALCRRDKRAATPLDIAMETGDHVSQRILTCTQHHHVGETAA